jgi:hypothetical protein
MSSQVGCERAAKHGPAHDADGMFGVTLFSISLTPVLDDVIQWFAERRAGARVAAQPADQDGPDRADRHWIT